MKKRIFCSMVALVGSAMALCFIFITGLLYEHYSNLQTEQLKETASYIEQGYEAAGQSYLETLHMGTNRVTLIAEDGTVLYDSQEQEFLRWATMLIGKRFSRRNRMGLDLVGGFQVRCRKKPFTMPFGYRIKVCCEFPWNIGRYLR